MKRSQWFVLTLALSLIAPAFGSSMAFGKDKEKKRTIVREPIYLCRSGDFAAPTYRIDSVTEYKLYASTLQYMPDVRDYLAHYKPAGGWYNLTVVDQTTGQVQFESSQLDFIDWTFLGIPTNKESRYEHKYGHTWFVLAKDNDTYGGSMKIAIDVGTGSTDEFKLNNYPIVKDGEITKFISDGGQKYSCQRLPEQPLTITEKGKKAPASQQQTADNVDESDSSPSGD